MGKSMVFPKRYGYEAEMDNGQGNQWRLLRIRLRIRHREWEMETKMAGASGR